MSDAEILEILEKDDYNLEFEKAEENLVVEHLKKYYIKENSVEAITPADTSVFSSSTDCCSLSECADVEPYTCF